MSVEIFKICRKNSAYSLEFNNYDLIKFWGVFTTYAEKYVNILMKSYSSKFYNYGFLIKFYRVFSTFLVQTPNNLLKSYSLEFKKIMIW